MLSLLVDLLWRCLAESPQAFQTAQRQSTSDRRHFFQTCQTWIEWGIPTLDRSIGGSCMEMVRMCMFKMALTRWRCCESYYLVSFVAVRNDWRCTSSIDKTTCKGQLSRIRALGSRVRLSSWRSLDKRTFVHVTSGTYYLPRGLLQEYIFPSPLYNFMSDFLACHHQLYLSVLPLVELFNNLVNNQFIHFSPLPALPCLLWLGKSRA